jgi:recombinational DNA repair protein RecR
MSSAAAFQRWKACGPRIWRSTASSNAFAEGGIDEVVLAMNATLEGQTTAHYLAERLEKYPVRLTQLAHGLPVGGELDYLDEGTLAQALRARTTG